MHRWGVNLDVCDACGATRQDDVEAGGLGCNAAAVLLWRQGDSRRAAEAEQRFTAQLARAEDRRLQDALETVLRAAAVRRR